MTDPGLVGGHPEGLGRLAWLTRGNALDIRRRAALVPALLDSHSESTAAEITRPLLEVAASMTEAAASLEWRATAIETAQGVTAYGYVGHRDHLADLAHFAAHAVFDPPGWRDSFREWCQPPDVAALGEMSPRQVAAVFAQLVPSVATDLAAGYPELIGHLDGAPPQLRYRANRILIHRRVGQLEDELRRLGEMEPLQWTDWTDPLWLLFRFPVRVETGAAVDRIRREIVEYRHWLAEDRQILLFDPSGDGRIVEVFGDLDQADHIAVVVPGISNDKTNFSSGDGGGFRSSAASLYESAAAIDSDIATIAWLGYDTPDGIDAGLRKAALTGAPALRRFLEGIDPEAKAAVSVVAHSYGSLVAGLAAAGGLAVNELVFVGSPGTGLENSTDARLRPAGRVWVGLAEADPIAAALAPRELPPWWVPVPFMPAWLGDMVDGAESLWHGTNPAADEFGAIRFDTSGSTGHSAYFEAGSLENLARIVVGRYRDVELAD